MSRVTRFKRFVYHAREPSNMPASTVRPALRFSQGTLTLEGVTRQVADQWVPDANWVYDPRTHQLRTDAMHYGPVQVALRSAGSFADHVPAWQTVPLKPNLPELRPEQQQAVEAWDASGQRGSIVMPTGTGKTIVALQIMAQRRTSTLIVAPVRDLMYQWHRRILEHFQIDAGIVGDQTYRVSPISVTTYDSACIHMPRLGNQFELLIFDECHHLPGPIRRDAARMSAARQRLGLTATYERGDGRHEDLSQLIGPLAFELSVTAVKGKTLADYDVVRIPVHLQPHEQTRYDHLTQAITQFMSEQRELNPHFRWEDVCTASRLDAAARSAFRAFHEKRSIEDRAHEKLRVLEDLFRLHAGEPILVFAGSNAMARDISLHFLVPCLLSHCGKRERLDLLQGLADGTYPVLVANRVLDEGVDLPEVKVAIVVGGMSSTRQAKQRLGRILRKRGNRRAVLYEVHTSTHAETKRSRSRRRNDAYPRVGRRSF